ncbi:hypothetical protein [Dyadobacter sandarakinus]|uniref:Uncharacterized protein n=1 Tax=Dyadobacter sandarakinus TaxID=2747268 RepID=A0ABX7I413_9BACT|nr:hypothetical protein [Dyadobacter sandarakinus]QRR00812.1 hypothetical protein HWI92_07770 [Dyadobacter sandarakinus]
MLKAFLLIPVLLSLALLTCAQDTTSVAFSEDTSGIEDQRFIDRYENVFMTKIPTRRMFKLGYTASTYKGIGLTAAFEYKVFPFLSLEAAVYSRAAREGDGIYMENVFRQLSGENLFVSGGSRWYPNMRKRIVRQQSANNLTGSYVSVLYERSLAAIQDGRVRDHFSLTYGFQSRFLANGFLDFSLGMYYLRPFPQWFTVGSVPSRFNMNNLVFASRSLIGLAFGDWKRTDRGPLCDILHCDYMVRQHFKVRLPELNIGIQVQSARLEVGYERKMGKSPFSVNLGFRSENNQFEARYTSRQGLTEFDGQLRFYYLQKSQIRKGKASDNLSGLYAGPHLGYRWTYEYFNHRRNKLLREPIAGLTAGYQQRLFNKLYFDSALSMSAIGFYQSVFKVRYGELNAKAGVGFAF